MKFSNKIFILMLITFSFLTSCGDDDITPPNEEEVITTLTYTLTPTSGDVVQLSFIDLDGDGGNAPTITGGTLSANTTYAGTIELLNESETPAENITTEIQDEKEEHQFFFTVVGNLDATVSYTDQDANGDPVGLTSSLTTGNASSGQLKIILRHEPDKSASDVSNGDPTNAGGETDIEVDFEVTIQ